MKILIRLPNALGDTIMGVAFISAVYQCYPQAIVHVILKKEINEVAELIPYPIVIHQFSKNEFKGLKGVYKFGKSLRKEKFDLVFCLPESISSSVICWATQAKHSIGFSNTLNLLLFTNAYKRPKAEHRVFEYVSLLERYANRKTENLEVYLSLNEITVTKELALINFNSEAISRRMPLDKATSILNDLSIQFPQTKFGLIGSQKESKYIDELLSNFSTGNFINYAGKTTIKSLAALMKTAKCMLSTDSGPAHLANGLNLPLMTLFGAGDEKNTAPYNTNGLDILRLGELPCEPCVKNTCIYGSPKCLELLENKNIINFFAKHIIN